LTKSDVASFTKSGSMYLPLGIGSRIQGLGARGFWCSGCAGLRLGTYDLGFRVWDSVGTVDSLGTDIDQFVHPINHWPIPLGKYSTAPPPVVHVLTLRV
jgi:hypothetical protein